MKRTIYLIAILLLVVPLFATAQLNKAYFYYQGQKHISQQKYTEAMPFLNTLIAVDSTIAEGWFLRGIAKYNLGDLNGALNDLGESIRFNPVFAQAYYYKAIVENRKQNFRQALADIETAIDLRPNDPDLVFMLGITHFQMLNYKNAIEVFSKVIRLMSNYPDAWINRGTARLLSSDTLGCIDDYSHAILLNPFYAEGYSRRGRVYAEQKKYDLALSDLNQAILLDSTSVLSYFSRAIVYSAKGKISASIDDFSRVLSLEPDNSLALYNRALIRSQIGDLNAALDDYTRLARLNPNNLLVYYNRAWIYTELGKLRLALDDYTSAIRLYPDFANAYLNRAIVKNRLGDLKGSEQDYNQGKTIAAKFHASKQDEFLAMADTSKKFNKLLSFEGDFSNANRSVIVEDQMAVPSDLLPFITFQISSNPKDVRKALAHNDFIDSLGSKLSGGFAFGLGFSSHGRSDQYRSEYLRGDVKLKASESHFINALTYSKQRRHNQAVTEYERALKADPGNYAIALNLIVERVEMARFVEQFSADVGVVSMSSLSTNQKKERAKPMVYAYGEAVKSLNELDSHLGESAVVQYNIGNAYFLMDDLKAATNAYTTALQREPEFVEALYNRGLLYLIQDDKSKGCADMSKAGELGLNQAYSIIQRYCKK